MDHSASAPSDAPTEEAPAEEAPAKARKKRTTVTFYLTDAMRNRARAAYRQTSYDERDHSWSNMITKALLAEVERREVAYNEGRVFVGNDEPLSPGRPIGY